MNTNKDETIELININDILHIPELPELPELPKSIKVEDIMNNTYIHSCSVLSIDTSDTSDNDNTTDDNTTDNTTDNTNDNTDDNTTDNTNTINIDHTLYMIYNEQTEISDEIQLLNYHKNKDCGYWKIAKMIIAHSTKDKTNTEFFLDSLDIELHKNYDKLENIEKVFYTNNLDIDIVYEFEGTIAMFIIENLKLFKFKPLGYVFNKDVNQNKWDFTISVITSKSIYTSNRYISENQIGFY